MPNGQYWAVLAVAAAAGLLLRALRRGPVLSRWAWRGGRVDLAAAFVALLALAFHCAAMFFPSVVAAAPATSGAAGAVSELGTASQVAYWLPAAVLLLAVRRAHPALLAGEAGALFAVGATMFWDFGLPAHLVAIAAAVLVTTALGTTLRTTGAGPGSRRETGDAVPA